MSDRIAVLADKAIQERVFPGCVVGVVRADGTRDVLPFGRFTYDATSPTVAEDTIYDLASVTKSIPLAALVAVFIEEGRLKSDDAVKTYLPELHNDYGATIEDLLTYRVHGPRMAHLRYATFEEIRTHILEHGFESAPGEARYTNLPAFLLGLIVERVAGEILPALADRYFFGPLDMADATFFPHDIARVPPTEFVDGAEVRGIVHDESARVFSKARRAVGHAGLFSTAPDLLNFVETMLYGDMPAVLRSAQKGWGWQQGEEWFMGDHFSAGSFGKTGFTGTSIAVDPKKGLGLVILSNRTYPTRPADAVSVDSAICKFRRAVADAVFL